MLKNIFFFSLFVLLSTAQSQDFSFSESVDLNSDNIKELITLNVDRERPNHFVLKINEISISDFLGEEGTEIDGFLIVDIDSTDLMNEVAVHNAGPSSDDEYLVFLFDGEQIKKVAHLSRWPRFKGNGVVYVDNWEGFWKRRDKYILDKKTHTLKLIPQFAYYVGINLRVKSSFPVYQNTDLKKAVDNLSEGSEITLLLCKISGNDWMKYLYLIKTEDDIIGWASFDSIYSNAEGFRFAD